MGWSSSVWNSYTRHNNSNTLVQHSWGMHSLKVAYDTFLHYNQQLVIFSDWLSARHCYRKWLQKCWRRQKNGTSGTADYVIWIDSVWKLFKPWSYYMLFYQSLPVAFGNEAAKWICVGAIDITQLSVAGMFIQAILLALFAYCFYYRVCLIHLYLNCHY